MSYSSIRALSLWSLPCFNYLWFQIETLPFSLSTRSHLPIPIPQPRNSGVGLCYNRGGLGVNEPGSHQVLTSLLPPTVVFPQDLLEKGLEADNFAMLGLGDIVIPGDWAGAGAVFPGSRSTVRQAALPSGREKETGNSTPTPWVSAV